MNDLFALTFYRPWPTLIMRAGKDCENRPIPPPRALIGQRVALHAGKKYGVGSWPAVGVDVPADVAYPTGIVGTALVLGALDLRGVRFTGHDRAAFLGGRVIVSTRGPMLGLTDAQRALVARLDALDTSLWWAGPVGILLAEPRELATPIACKGAQGWWRVPADVAAQVREQEASRS